MPGYARPGDDRPMDVYVIRHAIAVERRPDQEDAGRPLTDKGVRRFTRAVHGLSNLGVALDRVFHSPWRRAVETARLLGPVVVGEFESTELLTRNADERVLGLVQALPDTARVAFVGHEPWMGELASLLLTGTVEYADNLPFKKGGVAWLSGQVGAGTMALTGFFPPRVLRRLGEAR
ncbi:MAG: histidine phosphatase family protein [Myxococcota bacterium]